MLYQYTATSPEGTKTRLHLSNSQTCQEALRELARRNYTVTLDADLEVRSQAEVLQAIELLDSVM